MRRAVTGYSPPLHSFFILSPSLSSHHLQRQLEMGFISFSPRVHT